MQDTSSEPDPDDSGVPLWGSLVFLLLVLGGILWLLALVLARPVTDGP